MSRLFAVGLDNPKTNVNVGAVIRAVDVYGGQMVAVSGHRYSAAATDTMKGHRRIPVLHNLDDLHAVVPFDSVPVAVELIDDAISLVDYVHPKNAFYVFGAEDNTLGQRVLSWCRDVVFVPTRHCMNLAATVNVVLYDRMAKELRR